MPHALVGQGDRRIHSFTPRSAFQMRRALLAVSITFVACSVAAQCSITAYSISSNCGSDIPVAGVTLSGGTPPYSLTFQSANFVVTTAQSGQQGTVQVELSISSEPPVALSVSDAAGCVVTGSASYAVNMAAEPEVWFEYECGSGLARLHWGGTYFSLGTPEWYSTCAPTQYQVTGSQGYTQSGSFNSDWTLVAPSIWRHNTPLPTGALYSVRLGPSGYQCAGGAVNYCLQPYSVWVPTSTSGCAVGFRLRAALAGPMTTGGLMSDGLRAANLIPLTEPYSALGYAYVGQPANLTIPSATLSVTGSNAVVDWVVVELRPEAAPATVVYSEPALIQRDGDIVDVLGGQYVNAPVPAGRYHVAVRHRNHLGIMSADPFWLSVSIVPPEVSPAIIDLRNNFPAVYGTDARQTVGAYRCLWAGDATGNGALKYTGSANDRDPILVAIGGSTPNAEVTNVYDRRDTNLDGVVKYTGSGNDRDIILTNVGSTTPNNTRTQQLP